MSCAGTGSMRLFCDGPEGVVLSAGWSTRKAGVGLHSRSPSSCGAGVGASWAGRGGEGG